MKGNLPWQGVKASNIDEKYEKMREKKVLLWKFCVKDYPMNFRLLFNMLEI